MGPNNEMISVIIYELQLGAIELQRTLVFFLTTAIPKRSLGDILNMKKNHDSKKRWFPGSNKRNSATNRGHQGRNVFHGPFGGRAIV